GQPLQGSTTPMNRRPARDETSRGWAGPVSPPDVRPFSTPAPTANSFRRPESPVRPPDGPPATGSTAEPPRSALSAAVSRSTPPRSTLPTIPAPQRPTVLIADPALVLPPGVDLPPLPVTPAPTGAGAAVPTRRPSTDELPPLPVSIELPPLPPK